MYNLEPHLGTHPTRTVALCFHNRVARHLVGGHDIREPSLLDLDSVGVHLIDLPLQLGEIDKAAIA